MARATCLAEPIWLNLGLIIAVSQDYVVVRKHSEQKQFLVALEIGII